MTTMTWNTEQSLKSVQNPFKLCPRRENMSGSITGRPSYKNDPQFMETFADVWPKIINGTMSYGRAAQLCGCSKRTMIRYVQAINS